MKSWKRILGVLALFFTLSQNLLAKDSSESFLEAHRDKVPTSKYYVEAIAREIHAPIKLVQDVVNTYGLSVVYGGFLLLSKTLLNNWQISHRDKIHNGLSSLLFLHLIVYWGSMGMHYAHQIPMALMTHLVSYTLIMKSLGFLPTDLLHLGGGSHSGGGGFNFKFSSK